MEVGSGVVGCRVFVRAEMDVGVECTGGGEWRVVECRVFVRAAVDVGVGCASGGLGPRE